MIDESVERRLTTILAADIVGYSRLMAADETRTLTSLKAIRRELFEPKASQYHGRTVKLMGDGSLIEFPSVVGAVVFAVEVQCAMRERNAAVLDNRQIHFRVGINIGDIIVEGDDIYGDGVNIAARLEGLAEPGGICISQPVHTQIKGKLDLIFECLGEQQVKNIPEPVTAYRVVLDAKATALVTPLAHAAAVGPRGRRPAIAAGLVLGLLAIGGFVWWQIGTPGQEPASVTSSNSPLSDKPSIAVLPFENLSDDPEQAYFVDGITGDLITDLSKFPSLRVASRSSTVAYEEKPADLGQVSRDLGVKYILEGSVEKSTDRIRVTTRLIEGATGTQLWAERFDRELIDLFAIRDEIRVAIVGALTGYTGPITKSEQQRAAQKSPDRLTARDLYYQAYTEFSKFDEDANQQALSLLERSIALDPDDVGAHWLLAWVYWRNYWVFSATTGEKPLDRALEEARKSVELDRSDYRGHWVLGATLRLRGDNDTAMAEYERAFDLNPSDPDMLADWGEFLSYSGQPERAVVQLERAMALNPSYPDWYMSVLSRAYYNSKQYEKAILMGKRVVDLSIGTLEILAASYAQLGQIDQAKGEVEKILDRRPNYSIAEASIDTSMEEGLLQNFLDGLRKAGVPEQ